MNKRVLELALGIGAAVVINFFGGLASKLGENVGEKLLARR